MAKLSDDELYDIIRKHFGDLGDQTVDLMYYIVLAESGGDYAAVGDNAASGHQAAGSAAQYDYGLFQINSQHGYDAGRLTEDPEYNAAAARAIYDRQGPQAWSTYPQVAAKIGNVVSGPRQTGGESVTTSSGGLLGLLGSGSSSGLQIVTGDDGITYHVQPGVNGGPPKLVPIGSVGQSASSANVALGHSQLNQTAQQFAQSLALDMQKFGLSKEQVAQQATQFALTHGLNAQQFMASLDQFTASMGLSYAQLGQNDKQFGLSHDQRKSEFDRTFAFDNKKLAVDIAQNDAMLKFNYDKLKIETDAAAKEGTQTRIHQLEMQSRDLQMQQVQLNENARQFNMAQTAEINRDIAEYSAQPTDVGKLAGLMEAYGGPDALTKMIGGGQSAIDLGPLAGLLKGREGLAGMPTSGGGAGGRQPGGMAEGGGIADYYNSLVGQQDPWSTPEGFEGFLEQIAGQASGGISNRGLTPEQFKAISNDPRFKMNEAGQFAKIESEEMSKWSADKWASLDPGQRGQAQQNLELYTGGQFKMPELLPAGVDPNMPTNAGNVTGATPFEGLPGNTGYTGPAMDFGTPAGAPPVTYTPGSQPANLPFDTFYDPRVQAEALAREASYQDETARQGAAPVNAYANKGGIFAMAPELESMPTSSALRLLLGDRDFVESGKRSGNEEVIEISDPEGNATATVDPVEKHEKMPKVHANAAMGGVFDINSILGGQTDVAALDAAKAFQASVGARVRKKSPWATTRTPLQMSSPGMRNYNRQLAAAEAAAELGIDPNAYLEEIMGLLPMGVDPRTPTRRSA